MLSIEDVNKEFTLFKDQLASFLYRLVANKEDAEDLLQDTFLRVQQSISSFKSNSSFKTWVFSIANNLAKDHFRAGQRWGEDWMTIVKDVHVQNPEIMKTKMNIVNNSPHGKFVLHEHLSYCFDCTSKTLLLTNQVCLLLKEVYGFKISEIQLITDLSEGKVKHAIADARKDMQRIFKNKCALINKEGICSQCTGLNKIFNPDQEAQIEANKVKMVKEVGKENYDKLLDLRIEVVRGVDPLQAEGRDLHGHLFSNTPGWVEKHMN